MFNNNNNTAHHQGMRGWTEAAMEPRPLSTWWQLAYGQRRFRPQHGVSNDVIWISENNRCIYCQRSLKYRHVHHWKCIMNNVWEVITCVRERDYTELSAAYWVWRCGGSIWPAHAPIRATRSIKAPMLPTVRLSDFTRSWPSPYWVHMFKWDVGGMRCSWYIQYMWYERLC